ncbi:hypothetical protein [Roseivivax sp.]
MRIDTGLIAPVTALALVLSSGAYAASHSTGDDTKAGAEAGMQAEGSADVATGSGAGAEADTGAEASTEAQAGTSAQGQAAPAQDSAGDPERLVVMVGETEITEGDVMAMIAALPQQVRQMPQEQIVPIAVEQLILRELLVTAAQDAEITTEDSDVQAMIEENGDMAENDALARVYLDRELSGAVTDEAVQSTYEEIKANAESEVPPLEEVRPQIEKQVRQEAFGDLQAELQEDTRIVFYGPDGKPRSASTSEGAQSSGS